MTLNPYDKPPRFDANSNHEPEIGPPTWMLILVCYACFSYLLWRIRP